MSNDDLQLYGPNPLSPLSRKDNLLLLSVNVNT